MFLLGNSLGDDADGRVIHLEEVSHFLQGVLVHAYGLVDLFVSRCLVMQVLEERLKGGGGLLDVGAKESQSL